MCKDQMTDSQGSANTISREADLDLAKRAGHGESAALHHIVEQYAGPLFRMARRLCPTPADAEDVVQDTMIAIIQSVGRYDGRASLLTWMCAILFRKAGKARRRRGMAVYVSTDAADALSSTKDSQASMSDSRLDLAAVLPRLSPEHREVILLRELQSLSYAEIAIALNIAQGTVESRLHRARSELKRLLVAYDPKQSPASTDLSKA